MDRFLRSAFFPLIVVVLLVYLAAETWRGNPNGPTTRVPYSQLVEAVERSPHSIEKVVLERERSVVLERIDGSRWKATNPSEASQLALERRLIEQNVMYEWKRAATSWWSLMTSLLLPFALLALFFVFLQRKRDERAPTREREAV